MASKLIGTRHGAGRTKLALAKQVQNSILQEIPDCPITILSHSRDLGFELQYSGAHRVGHRVLRYEEGYQRLERLEKLKVDLCTKEHAILSSVWPATLYGCEIFPPSGELLTRLASKAADALVGKSKAMTTMSCFAVTWLPSFGSNICCHSNGPFVQQEIGSFRAHIKTDTGFFHLVATASGRSHDIKGPASALRYYLDLVAWKCDKLGFIQVAPFLKIHLLQDSWQRVEYFLTQAWQQDLIVTRSHRTSLFGLPDVNRQDTVAVLAKYDEASRRKLVREIAGAFQTSNQKQHWVSNHSMQCIFCTEQDSKKHRLCHCPAFAEIREPFQGLLANLLDDDHSMLEFPVIHIHQDHLVHQHLQFVEPRAVFSDALLERIRSIQSPNQ